MRVETNCKFISKFTHTSKNPMHQCHHVHTMNALSLCDYCDQLVSITAVDVY
jgi:hypothetical protein